VAHPTARKLTCPVDVGKACTRSGDVAQCTQEDIRRYGLTLPIRRVGIAWPSWQDHAGELSKKQLTSGGNITVVVDNLEKEGSSSGSHVRRIAGSFTWHDGKGERALPKDISTARTFCCGQGLHPHKERASGTKSALEETRDGLQHIRDEERSPRGAENGKRICEFTDTHIHHKRDTMVKRTALVFALFIAATSTLAARRPGTRISRTAR